jgi:hypothetical protein
MSSAAKKSAVSVAFSDSDGIPVASAKRSSWPGEARVKRLQDTSFANAAASSGPV